MPGSNKSIAEMNWLADGITKWERWASDSLRAIAYIDTETAALMLNLPWVSDGITPSESSAISGVRGIMDEDPELAKVVLGLWWVPDDLTLLESRVLVAIRDLARENPALAWQVIGHPFMGPPMRQRDEYALNILWQLATSAELEQYTSLAWFSDGLDDLEAALLKTLISSNQRYRRALMESHYVSSAPVVLPLAGDVEVIAVRHTPFPPDDHTLATLEEGLRSVEGFMAIPFPVTDIILLVVDTEIWSVGGRTVLTISDGEAAAYTSGFILVDDSSTGPSKGTIYHELAHYYGLSAPKWFNEGVSEFLEAYTIAQSGGKGLEEQLAHLESSSPCSRENVQEHIDSSGGIQCSYDLGEKFMLVMYTLLGQEAVSATLRDLHAQSRSSNHYFNEELIYQAFLSNVPSAKEEAFKDAYRQYHGGPFVDAVVNDSPDFAPLVALYNASNGEGWANNEYWTLSVPLGAWHGVTTGPEGRVSVIDLKQNALTGGISAELGSLSELRFLSLRLNSLVGEIPPELRNLSKLRHLDLGGNQLDGGIPPELGHLSNLQLLNLASNPIDGEIPPELGNLTSLTLLTLTTNQLSGGIPPELGNLNNLQSLSLSRNQLNDEIPSELGRLSEITWLDLGYNQLSGEIPPELGNLSKLKLLRLWRNRLTGSIPPELGNLTSLTSLELKNNRLGGGIPPELSKLANLRVFDLDENKLIGKIPPELGSLPNLVRLSLSKNRLSGEIPSELGNLGGILTLDLSQNLLSGEIPPELSHLPNLETLFLAGNRFTGCIPEALRNTSKNDLDKLGLPFCDNP